MMRSHFSLPLLGFVTILEDRFLFFISWKLLMAISTQKKSIKVMFSLFAQIFIDKFVLLKVLANIDQA